MPSSAGIAGRRSCRAAGRKRDKAKVEVAEQVAKRWIVRVRNRVKPKTRLARPHRGSGPVNPKGCRGHPFLLERNKLANQRSRLREGGVSHRTPFANRRWGCLDGKAWSP